MVSVPAAAAAAAGAATAVASRAAAVGHAYRLSPPWPAWRGAAGRGTAEPAISLAGWSSVRGNVLSLEPVTPIGAPHVSEAVPALAHGLSKVLSGDGLYLLSKGSAFGSRYLREIVQPPRIRWEAFPRYVPANEHSSSHAVARDCKGVCYISSTSSMTPTLSALYHLLSNFRETELIGGLGPSLGELPADFAKFQRKPTAFTISPVKGGRYEGDQLFAIGAHGGVSKGPSILLELGNSIERMLTTSSTEFLERFVLPHGAKDYPVPRRPSADLDQFYHYSRVGSFLIRSQIDCRNPQTNEVFDVKTRAVAPIRYNIDNYRQFAHQRLRRLTGLSDSYEREFYDMVRSVFIKYAMQLRIGRMSGAFIAYHNTRSILGMEYIPLSEIEAYVFGGSHWASVAFSVGVGLFERILSRVRSSLFANGEQHPVKVLLATERSRRRMVVYAQRLRKDSKDLLSPEKFYEIGMQKPNSSEPGGIGSKSSMGTLEETRLWHLDADMHEDAPPGVARVGACEEVGGKRVLTEIPPEVIRRRRKAQSGPAFDVNNHDISGLTTGEFYVWHLDAAPLVNGMIAPKGGIRVGKDDDFELKFDMTRVKDVSDFVKAEYVRELARLYMP